MINATVVVIALYTVSVAVKMICFLGFAICCLGCVQRPAVAAHMFQSQKSILLDTKACCVCQSMSSTSALLLWLKATVILDSTRAAEMTSNGVILDGQALPKVQSASHEATHSIPHSVAHSESHE